MRKSTENPQTVKRLSLPVAGHPLHGCIYLHIAGDNVKFIALFFAPSPGSCCACVPPPPLPRDSAPSHPLPLPLPLLCINQKVNGCIFMTAPPSSSFIVVRLALPRFYHTNISVIINAIKMKKYVVNFMCCPARSLLFPPAWLRGTSFLYSSYKCFRGHKFPPPRLNSSVLSALSGYLDYKLHSKFSYGSVLNGFLVLNTM